jgi:hypothetical protein
MEALLLQDFDRLSGRLEKAHEQQPKEKGHGI